MRSLALLVANYILIDPKSNNGSLINILEQLNVSAFPAVVPAVHVFGLVHRNQPDDPNLITIRLEISANGQVVGGHQFNVDFENRSRNRLMIEIQSLIVPAPGVLKFELSFQNAEQEFELLDEWPIEITQIQGPVVDLLAGANPPA